MDKPAERSLVIFIATDSEDELFRYRQAFAEVCPLAITYFFARKGELLHLGYELVLPKEVSYPKFLRQLRGLVRAFV